MTTNKRRLAGYLSDSLYEAFQRFKEERDIQWDSEALCQILTEYFDVDPETNSSVSDPLMAKLEQALSEKLLGLQTQIDNLSDRIDRVNNKETPTMSDFFKTAHSKYYERELK